MIESQPAFFENLSRSWDPPNLLIVGAPVVDHHVQLQLVDGEDVSVDVKDGALVFHRDAREAAFPLGSKVCVNENPQAAWVVGELNHGGFPILHKEITRGGNANNVATALGRLREGSSSMGTVTWYTDMGENTAQEIARDTGIAIIRENEEPVRPIAVGTIVTLSGYLDRVILSQKPTGEHTFDPNKIPHDPSHLPSLAVITSNGPEFAKEAREFRECMRKQEVPVAFMPGSSEMKAIEQWLADPSNEKLKEKRDAVYGIVEHADMVVANRDEIKMLVSGFGMIPSDDPRELLVQMKAIHSPEGYTPQDPRQYPISKGPRVVSMTDGANPIYVIDGERKIYAAQPYPVEVVNTAGAGDAFAGGLIGGYISGKPLLECIQWGLANSASVLEHVGTTTGLLDQNGIEERIARHPDYQVLEF